jgi:hypothetical protein
MDAVKCIGVLALATLTGCRGILGLNPPVDEVDAGADSSPSGSDAADDSPLDETLAADALTDGATDPFEGSADAREQDAGVVCNVTNAGSRGPWADWPMPNPPGSGLPNQQTYDTSQQGVVIDLITGLMWHATAAPESTFMAAQAYCAGSAEASFQDWRLPSRIELVSIVDFSHDPAINRSTFPNTPSQPFWSSSVARGFDGPAQWTVDFADGTTSVTANPGGIARARCVRTCIGHPPITQHYSFGMNTIYDNRTRLTWQRNSMMGSWSNAFASCSTMATDGGGPWRAPAANELQTLVDETQGGPGVALDTMAFPGTLLDPVYWSATPSLTDPMQQAWTVKFADAGAGSSATATKMSIHAYRCVR